MRVCLVYPGEFFRRAHGLTMSFSQQLFYLYSYLRKHAPQVEVEVLDLRREVSPLQPIEPEPFLAEAEALLARSGADLVGISCWTTYNYPSSVEIAKICKRLNPECTVVVGGWHPTFVPEDFTYPGSPFDYVVKGEGEKALLDIVTGQIPREQPTTVVQGTAEPLGVHDLRWGECPYHRTMEYMPVWLSRGCPFACTFCADRLSNYRFIAPRDAIAELQRLVTAYPQVKHVLFYDPLFGIRKDWRREFLTLLHEADLPVAYWAETRLDLVDHEDVDLLARLPFRVDMGLESVVPELLAIMKKTADPAAYLARCRDLDAYMNQKGVVHQLNHIYNHPGETSRTLQQSLDFWQDYYRETERAGRRASYTHVSVALFMFMPGSDVYFNWDDYAAKYGCTIADRGWWRQTEYPLEGRSQYVVGSRELAEGEAPDLPARAAEELTALSVSHMNRDAFKSHMLPHDWENTFLMLRSALGARYFEDKPLRLHPRAALYPQPDGGALLRRFGSPQSRPLSATGRERLGELLAGRPVTELAAALPEDERAVLRRFATDLLAAGLLEIGFPPPSVPVAGWPRVRLATSAGELELELDADAAPGPAASFLHLAAGGYYDGLRFDTPRPSTYVEVGGLSGAGGQEPGYTLPAAPTGLAAERGAVGLVREGDRLHGSRVRFYRRAPAPGEAACVFGRVVAGLDVLDRLLNGDYVLRVALAVPAAGGA